ncbi:major facilitator superfamily domain-containing protein [Yarrowia lipolytica]|nr:major facilitator superfamily domain-containing protein [Yarrowia lipolytica]KAE8168848.1 major facilitator superfamily domain-containing protein [Yarrowia lipolytica]
MAIYGEPPGTVLLESEAETIVLQPHPSSDPNEPLNWPPWRKHFNFVLVCFFTLIAFTSACVSSVFWGPWIEEFGWTLDQLNNTYAFSVAGLGLGCPLLIPFAHKFGKRPVYIVASALVVACAAWQSRMHSIGEVYSSFLIQGLAVSITETIIQMTVADLYFVHQRGTFNGIYMFVVDVGNFLILVPAGYITVNLGWRWVYIIVAIIAGGQFLMTVFLFEETKYLTNPEQTFITEEDSSEEDSSEENCGAATKYLPQEPKLDNDVELQMNPLSKRLALVTYTPARCKEFGRKMIIPFVTLISYPIVAFSAIQYGFMLTWLSMAATTSANSFALPPYNFSSAAIGNVNIAPFVGMIFGSVFGGWFNDKTIIWLSNRNKGIYEPEFRLYSLVFANFSLTVGVFLFGTSLANRVHWMVPTIGFAIIMFGFGSSGAIVVTYLLDCYDKIVADAFIGVIVVRNGLAMVIIFCLGPWEERMGLQNVYIMAGCFSLVPLILTVPMIIWGKELRRKSGPRYLKESLREQAGTGTSAVQVKYWQLCDDLASLQCRTSS